MPSDNFCTDRLKTRQIVFFVTNIEPLYFVLDSWNTSEVVAVSDTQPFSNPQNV